MRKLFSFITVLILGTVMMMAQNKTVTGSVISAEDGEAIIGASVVVTGTNTGTVTDIEGNFSLKVPTNAKTLTISYVGMLSQQVNISNKKILVQLSSNDEVLDEVMVVAYGTQKKSAFTGSAAIVNSDEIGKVQVTNAVDALKGKAAGVQITTSTGQPGATPSIRIRGFSSLIASQSPLIVLDGSPFDGSLNDINPGDVESMTVLKDAASTALYGARGGNGVIIITTKAGNKGRDSEISFEAKWGSNMKGGRDYDVINDPRGYYETYYQGLYNYAINDKGMDPSAAWKWANKNLIDRSEGFGLGYQVYDTKGQVFIGANGKVNPAATLGNVVTGVDGKQYLLTPDKWQDEIYHTGVRQQYTFSARGNSDKGSYYASADYLKNEGITYSSNYKRFSARLKADYQLKKWLRFNANVSYTNSTRNYMSEEGSSSSGNIFALQYIAPIYPVFMRDAEGNVLMHQASGIKAYDYSDVTVGPGISRPYLSQANPISDLLVDTRETTTDSFNGTAGFDISLPFNITFSSLNNFYLSQLGYTGITNPYFGQYKSSNGIINKETDRDFSTNFQQRLNWHGVFGKNDIEVSAIHEYYKSKSSSLYGSKHNMFSQKIKELNGAVVVDDTGSSLSEYNTESWIGRAMYNFDERYYVQGSITRQASSVFHPDHRWGTFWSGSASWMISKESFMENVKWVDELKVKASFGQNGNDGGLNGYYYTNRYTIINSNNNVSLNPSTLGKNEELSWETSTKFNTGIDFSLFKGRLTGTIEYYNNHTSGLISSVPYAPSFGYTSYYDNIGNMSNKGVEIDLHGVAYRNRDLQVNVYANITSNKNEITELAESRKTQTVYSIDNNGNITGEYKGYSSGSYFYSEGASRYSYYTKKYFGIYTEDTYKSTYKPGTPESEMSYDPSKAGTALYYINQKDADGNVIGTYATDNGSSADYYNVGDVLPSFYGGFGTSVTYKGIDLSVDFTYQWGGKVYDSEYQSLMGFDDGYGYHVDLQNSWSLSNPNSNIPRLNVGDSYNVTSSDRFLIKSDYLCLNNVTIGYTFPKNLLRKIYLTKLRLYAVADNLYTFSARKGLDPRGSVTGGSNSKGYSSIRTVSFGVQVSF